MNSTAHIDVAACNAANPKYPVTMYDKGWVYGVWYCPTAWIKTHFHGQYPLTFLRRALSLFSGAVDILHCPSGTVTGPGVTVDMVRDEKRQPQITASADDLPLPDDSFDLYLSDPPYTKEDSAKYGCPPYPMKAAMAEARRILRPGGYFGLLNTRYPSFRRGHWEFTALISVVTGANRMSRLFTVFRKPPLP